MNGYLVGADRNIAGLVSGIGLEPVDVGPLRYARIIEGLHYLRYNAGQVGESRINFYFPRRPELKARSRAAASCTPDRPC